jgi:hypothetical protein
MFNTKPSSVTVKFRRGCGFLVDLKATARNTSGGFWQEGRLSEIHRG